MINLIKYTGASLLGFLLFVLILSPAIPLFLYLPSFWNINVLISVIWIFVSIKGIAPKLPTRETTRDYYKLLDRTERILLFIPFLLFILYAIYYSLIIAGNYYIAGIFLAIGVYLVFNDIKKIRGMK